MRHAGAPAGGRGKGTEARWRRAAAGLRRRLRPWRRVRFTWGGMIFTGGAAAVGFAAVNTGNNLLHLLLGAMLGLIVVSGWLSERTLRNLEVQRHLPGAVTAGQEAAITYEVRNRARRSPSFAVEISEPGLPGQAFAARVEPGGSTQARAYARMPRRGVVWLDTVTLTTSFPFGLFLKERDLHLPAELVVWPRSQRHVEPLPARLGPPSEGADARPSPGGVRGEYRSFREYRPGDEPRDIHWRTSARLAAPVVREYDAPATESLWICLDTRGAGGELAEALIEVAASLAADASRHGRSFGLVAGGRVLPPAAGAGQLERALDALARVEFDPHAAAPVPPAGPSRALLVSATRAPGGRFAARYAPALAKAGGAA